MKIILSRKGFDSSNGGIPSPILPDGTLLSLPIPDKSCRLYSELLYKSETYQEIINQLYSRRRNKFKEKTCHLDPDVREGVFKAPAGWKPAFGQCNSSLSHLNNQNVGVDDLFLFFGWFRQTEYDDNGRLKYKRNAPDIHIIYGYLQVGTKITNKSEIKKYSWHPHGNMATDNNCLFTAREKCLWNPRLKGYGVFKYNKELVLTKNGMNRSCWKLPKFFENLKISGAGADAWKVDSNGEKYCQIANKKGQEFVIEESKKAEEWAKSLIG